uniref:Secreted protein n=1 Tax=Trichogramma kaykai TaxID=54128 RepID=A0ABD2WSR1_9HYME
MSRRTLRAATATAQLYAFALSLRRSLDRVRPHTSSTKRACDSTGIYLMCRTRNSIHFHVMYKWISRRQRRRVV